MTNLVCDNLERLLETPNAIKHVRNLIMQLAVQGKLVRQDPNDEPAEVLLKRILKEKERLLKEGKVRKTSALPPINDEEKSNRLPKGWMWVRLGEFTNYGTSEKAEPSDLADDTWILDLEDIEKDTSKLLARARFKDRNSRSTKSLFRKGDVLYGKLRPYLDKVIVADDAGACTTEILPIRPYLRMDPYYLRLCLKSPAFIEYVGTKVYGMKMPRLGTEDGQMATLPMCPLAEQSRIVAKVNRLMMLCDEVEAKTAQLREDGERLMKAVMAKAMAAWESN